MRRRPFSLRRGFTKVTANGTENIAMHLRLSPSKNRNSVAVNITRSGTCTQMRKWTRKLRPTEIKGVNHATAYPATCAHRDHLASLHYYFSISFREMKRQKGIFAFLIRSDKKLDEEKWTERGGGGGGRSLKILHPLPRSGAEPLNDYQ